MADDSTSQAITPQRTEAKINQPTRLNAVLVVLNAVTRLHTRAAPFDAVNETDRSTSPVAAQADNDRDPRRWPHIVTAIQSGRIDRHRSWITFTVWLRPVEEQP